MEKMNHSRISGMGVRLTSTISVMLVLFILGLVAFINISFDGIERRVKEKMGFAVVLTDSVPQAMIDTLTVRCQNSDYISEFKYLSSEDVLAEETKGDGKELVDMLGVNPYAPMFEVRLTADYANVDSMNIIINEWESLQCVDYVDVNTELIRNLDSNSKMLNAILLIVAAALLLISFVLINNTVKLSVYAKRFLIHTMKLVGATGAFIRRPFLTTNIVQGVCAGALASALLTALLIWARSVDVAFEALIPWNVAFIVFAALLLLGALICGLAAMIATNRYLRINYDDMFD